MAYIPQFGLQKIEIGDPVRNNTEPVALTVVPFTAIDTAAHTNEEGTKTPVNYEESSAPLVILSSEAGANQLVWTTYSNDFELLARLEGGTYTPQAGAVGATYAPPPNAPAVSLFVKATYIQGGGVKIFNGSVSVVRNNRFTKEGLPELTITVTPQDVDAGFSPVLQFAPVTA